MEEKILDNYENKSLVCNKGNMLLESYIRDNKKAYNLKYDFNKLNSSKVNINALLGTGIYELLENINKDLIEKIYILNILNENETDICILLNHIAKEIGIKQKYILFRTTRGFNHNNGTIVFYNKDISIINPELKDIYLNKININKNKYDPLIFNNGKTIITLNNLEFNDLNKIKNNENINKILDINFNLDFQILINDDLPLYMENLIGLMFKKIFYNLKQFVDSLNN